jgi:hypothetical protein
VSAWLEFAVLRCGDGGRTRLDPRPEPDKLGLRPADSARFRNRSLTFAAPFRAVNVRERFSQEAQYLAVEDLGRFNREVA